MTGRGRFLIFGVVTILVASSVLFYGFSMWQEQANSVNLLTDRTDGGELGVPVDNGAEQDSGYSAPDEGGATGGVSNATLSIGTQDIPWESGLTAFVLLSSGIMIVLFARLREEDVLEGLRKDIYDYIEENPGEHLAGIIRQFGISSSSARHHLDVLEWSDMIVSHRSGKQKHFYPNRNGYRQYTRGFEYKEIMAILKNDTCRGMVKVLISNDRANQKMIASKLHIHPSTVNWHAKRLRGAQIIFKTRDGKDIHYSLNPELDLVKVISIIEGASS